MYEVLQTLFELGFLSQRPIPAMRSLCELGVHAKADFVFETLEFRFEFERKGVISLLHYTPYGKYRGIVIDVPSDYSGMSEVLNASNSWCPPTTSHHEESPTLGVDPDISGPRSSDQPPYRVDNCIGIVFNLIRMVYATTLKDIEYDPHEPFVQGKGLHVTNAQFFQKSLSQGYIWTPSVEVLPTQRDMLPEDCGEVWLHWKGPLSERDAQIVSAAASSWPGTSPLGVLHMSEQLTEKTIRLVGDIDEFEDAAEVKRPLDLDDLTMQEVMDVLSNVVTSNKLETCFTIALGYVAQIYISHKPNCLDGLIWCYPTRDMKIPRLLSFRGRINSMVLGNGLELQQQQKFTFAEWKARPERLFWCASDLSEVAHNQMYLFVLQYLRFPAMLNQALNDMMPREHQFLAFDLMLAAIHSGRDVRMPLSTNAGLDRFNAKLFGLYRYLIGVTVDSLAGFVSTQGYLPGLRYRFPYRTAVKLFEYVPFVNPIIMQLGNPFAGIAEAVSKISELKVNAHGIISTVSRQAFIDFLLITRMMGLSVTCHQLDPFKVIMNMTNTDMGWYIHHPPSGDHQEQYEIDVGRISTSGLYFLTVPEIRERVKVSVKITEMVVVEMWHP